MAVLTTQDIVDRDPQLRAVVDRLQADPELINQVLEQEKAGILLPSNVEMLAQLRGLGIVPPAPGPAVPSTWERVGRGQADMLQGVRKLGTDYGLPPWAGGYTPEQVADINQNIELYEAGVKADPDYEQGDWDWARLGGNVGASASLALIPGAAAPAWTTRAVTGGLAGSLGGAAYYTDDPRERLGNTLGGTFGGAIGGAVAPKVVEGVARTAGAVGRAGSEVRRRLLPGRELREAAAQAAREAVEQVQVDLGTDDAIVGALEQQAADYAEELLAAGVEPTAPVIERQLRATALGFVDDAAPTAGQLSRNRGLYSAEQNTAKRVLQNPGGPGQALPDRFDNQAGRVNEILDETGEALGEANAPATDYRAGNVVARAAQDRAKEWQGQVGELYRLAKEAEPDATLPGNLLADAVGPLVRRLQVPSNVRAELNRLINQPEGIDPVEFQQLDKMLTQNMGVNDAVDYALGELKQAVRGLMDNLPGDFGPAYRRAVAGAAARFDAIGEPQSLTGTLVRGRFRPEKVAQRIKTGAVDEVRALRDFVGQYDPDAWQQIVSRVWVNLKDAAMPGGDFTQDALNKALRSYEPETLEILFGPEITRRLFATGQMARDLFKLPPGHVVNTSNTAPMLSALGDKLSMLYPGGAALREASRPARDRAAMEEAVEQALSGLQAPPLWQQLSPNAATAARRVGSVPGRTIAVPGGAQLDLDQLLP